MLRSSGHTLQIVLETKICNHFPFPFKSHFGKLGSQNSTEPKGVRRVVQECKIIAQCEWFTGFPVGSTHAYSTSSHSTADFFDLWSFESWQGIRSILRFACELPGACSWPCSLFLFGTVALTSGPLQLGRFAFGLYFQPKGLELASERCSPENALDRILQVFRKLGFLDCPGFRRI